MYREVNTNHLYRYTTEFTGRQNNRSADTIDQVHGRLGEWRERGSGDIIRGDMVQTTMLEMPKPRSLKSNSPFRYPGGKFYARKLILDMLPPHTGYCEPFAGGASIFFAKPKVEDSILNDLDSEVINTLACIRDDVEGLTGLLDGLPASKYLHSYYKSEYQPVQIWRGHSVGTT